MPSRVPAGQSQAGTMSLLQSKLCLLLLQPQERQGDTGRRSSVCSTGCCSGPRTEVVGTVWLPQHCQLDFSRHGTACLLKATGLFWI